ncbi:MAG TPA: hypothetical protein VJ110_02350 [Candidatus Nanoarchaeia archaeon]|nr:hypothetical protein [Candidatus Nanoarchaeia archaeon]
MATNKLKLEISLKEGKGEKEASSLRDTANRLAVPLNKFSDISREQGAV